MNNQRRRDFTIIISDNENAAAHAISEENYVQAFLLIHSLIESLLRLFLKVSDDKLTFSRLIYKYQAYLDEHHYHTPTFVNELTQLNKRRNRIVHQLWVKGYSNTNKQAELAAHAAMIVYGLFIEWLETFDPEICEIGFQYDQSENGN